MQAKWATIVDASETIPTGASLAFAVWTLTTQNHAKHNDKLTPGSSRLKIPLPLSNLGAARCG